VFGRRIAKLGFNIGAGLGRGILFGSRFNSSGLLWIINQLREGGTSRPGLRIIC